MGILEAVSMQYDDDNLLKFDIPEIIYGRGALAGVGHCAERLGGEKVFLVTDPGIIQALGGDQDIEIVIHKRLVHPEHPSMVGRPLPDLRFGKGPVDPNQVQAKRVVVCFWSMDSKVKEKAVAFCRQLEKSARKDVWACFVSIYSLEPKIRDKIVKQFSFPVFDSIVWTEMDLLQRKWGAKEIPWFVVTDKDHIIVSEGTSSQAAIAVLQ